MIDLSLICKNELKAPKNLKAFSEINKVAGTKKTDTTKKIRFLYVFAVFSFKHFSPKRNKKNG